MSQWSKLCIVFILSTVCTVSRTQSSILFPHGYFDTNKLTAADAFYLNMLAISTLENGGITEQELDKLAESRKKPAPLNSLQAMIEKNMNATHNDGSSEEFESVEFNKRPLIPLKDGNRRIIPKRGKSY